MKNTFLILSLFVCTLFAQEERQVLVEIFTNSHCPLCPAAHNVIDNYLMGPNGNKISYIFYHMIYPYNDDPLYWQSQEGSDARDNYYNPVAATPQGWFDGIIQGSSSGWTNTLDNLVATTSPLKIELSGYTDHNQIFIDANVTRTGDISDEDLVIHFVVVEDIFYDGRNTVSNHKHVMRQMLPTPAGLSFNIDPDETKYFRQIIDLDPIWDKDSLAIIVFVQSNGSKTVYQSATIAYDELTITNLESENHSPSDFKLFQNYPNPFNPSTVISYLLPASSDVTIKVYDLLGREVATLVDEYKTAGRYEVEFDASKLSSGVYFYKLSASNYITIKKLMLLK